MTITAQSNASQRTKNRIRENGTEFHFMNQATFKGSGLLQGRECVLVQAPRTEWVGWLPLDEIIGELK